MLEYSKLQGNSNLAEHVTVHYLLTPLLTYMNNSILEAPKCKILPCQYRNHMLTPLINPYQIKLNIKILDIN